MYFVGLDLAWGERKPTGVAVVDDAGKLVQLGAATDDTSIRAAVAPYVQGDCLVAFDAPLVVNNPTGQRPSEAALNRDYTLAMGAVVLAAVAIVVVNLIVDVAYVFIDPRVRVD